MTTKKTRKYGWAVVNEAGTLMREENDRRAIYRTREQARMAARVLDGRPVRRDEVAEPTPANLTAPEQNTDDTVYVSMT